MKAKLQLAIEETRRILGVPDEYRIAVVPASDTGAIEMAMWSMLGERPVRVGLGLHAFIRRFGVLVKDIPS